MRGLMTAPVCWGVIHYASTEQFSSWNTAVNGSKQEGCLNVLSNSNLILSPVLLLPYMYSCSSIHQFIDRSPLSIPLRVLLLQATIWSVLSLSLLSLLSSQRLLCFISSPWLQMYEAVFLDYLRYQQSIIASCT